MVVALEAGRRDLSIDEFARLPRLLNRLGIATEGFQVHIEAFADRASMRVGHLQTSLDLTLPWVGTATESDLIRRAHRAVDWGDRVSVPATEERGKDFLLAAYESAGAELEQKVGRQWELEPFIVALVACEKWGRSLTEERDTRVAAQTQEGTPQRAVQALRGHITRSLSEELAPDLTAAKRRLRATGATKK